MADIGPLTVELQRKRIQVEIRRLEHQIEMQEMEIMTLEEEISRKSVNIEASKKDLVKQQEMLAEADQRIKEKEKIQSKSEGPGEE